MGGWVGGLRIGERCLIDAFRTPHEADHPGDGSLAPLCPPTQNGSSRRPTTSAGNIRPRPQRARCTAIRVKREFHKCPNMSKIYIYIHPIHVGFIGSLYLDCWAPYVFLCLSSPWETSPVGLGWQSCRFDRSHSVSKPRLKTTDSVVQWSKHWVCGCQSSGWRGGWWLILVLPKNNRDWMAPCSFKSWPPQAV